MALGEGRYDKYLTPIVEDVEELQVVILIVLPNPTVGTDKPGMSIKVTADITPNLAAAFRIIAHEMIEEAANGIDSVAQRHASNN